MPDVFWTGLFAALVGLLTLSGSVVAQFLSGRAERERLRFEISQHDGERADARNREVRDLLRRLLDRDKELGAKGQGLAHTVAIDGPADPLVTVREALAFDLLLIADDPLASWVGDYDWGRRSGMSRDDRDEIIKAARESLR